MIRHNLIETLSQIGPAAIAVSGGVDSMTLACVAARLAKGYEIFHAISPAVSAQATQRVRRYAESEGWKLHLIDAGEFNDPRYRENPLNRCYFCKTNLYAGISGSTSLPILSGTNLDDLDDFRPGLNAAREFDVHHPFVEAGIEKVDVRRIARELDLTDLSELPAAPCLSSRVETGIRIEAADLTMIDRVENFLSGRLGAVALRCRIRKSGLCIEIDSTVLTSISKSEIDGMVSNIQKTILPPGCVVNVAPYVRGSAFIGAKNSV